MRNPGYVSGATRPVKRSCPGEHHILHSSCPLPIRNSLVPRSLTGTAPTSHLRPVPCLLPFRRRGWSQAAGHKKEEGHMKTNGQITAALLVATLAAVGCSHTDETQQSQRGQTTPVSMTTGSPSPTPVADKTPIGPVSFADGEAAYRAGNYKSAENVFEQYTKQEPANAWGHFMLGLSASKSGDPAKAEIAFGEALRLDPNHVKSMTNLSRVLIDQKRFEEAFEKLKYAEEKEPNSAEVHRLLGRTYRGQGKTEDAIASYHRAIELDDKDAWSMNDLGLLFLEQDRPDDAVPLLAKAVLLKKDVAIFHNNLG